MSDLEVKIDPKEGRILVYCNKAFNDLVRALPNRRWNKTKSCWTAPLVRANAQVILDRFTKFPSLQISDRAMEKLREVATITYKPTNLEKFPQWYKFKTNPFPHQMDALDFMWGRNQAALFMEMGTGKSKALIDCMSARFLCKQIDALIVFCPYGIRHNWVGEFETHCPVDYDTCVIDTGIHNFEKKFGQWIIGTKERLKVVIVGMESISAKEKDGKAYKALCQFVNTHTCGVAVDESQYIKSHRSNRTTNAIDIRSRCKFPVVMTGTPITQGYTDLYSQFDFLSPDIIGVGDFYSFRGRYCIMGGFQSKTIIDYTNTDELMDLVTPWTFQVKKEDVIKDLPPKTYQIREVEMSKEQRKLYDEVKRNRFASLKDIIKHHGDDVELICENVLTMYSALQQIAGGFVSYWDESGETKTRKLSRVVPVEKNPSISALIDVVEESAGASAIIWARYREEIAMISEALRGRYGDGSVVEYHGGVSNDDRQQGKQAFLDGRARFFIANAETGGTGLTLNTATLTIYYSNDFKLVNRQQSEDRNHRIGQKNAVLYVDLVRTKTIDTKIIKAIKDKKDLANYVKERIAMGKLEDIFE
ncbi:helicase [Acinetobacter phage JeffCo]|nr:helicase [Acinetobacter phage JeffCo]